MTAPDIGGQDEASIGAIDARLSSAVLDDRKTGMVVAATVNVLTVGVAAVMTFLAQALDACRREEIDERRRLKLRKVEHV